MIHVDFEQQCMPNRNWRWNTVSHLTCDPTDDLEPLHRFAVGIGLKRAWFQPAGAGIMPHYDLTPGKRIQAVLAGAHELLERRAVYEVIQAWRAFLEAPKPGQLALAL